MLAAEITDFIHANHVLSLAVVQGGVPWAASCFYVFDARACRFIILTDPATRHGAAMLANPVVAGTVAGQPKSIRAIRGVQFLANAALLTDAAAEEARALYYARHPLARLKPAAVWALRVDEIKFTSNASVFGRKQVWRRGSAG